jgi:hypothetical protein
MDARAFGLLVACFFLVLPFSSGTAVASPPTFPGAGDDGLLESRVTFGKLNSIIVPKADFDDEDIYKVIEFLNRESVKLDPAHVGVRIRVEVEHPLDGKLSGPEWDVTVHLSHASLLNILGQVCEDDELYWYVSKGDVLLICGGISTASTEPPALLRAEKHLRRKLRAIVFPSVDFEHKDIVKVIAYLNAQNRKLDPDHAGTKIVLHLPLPSGQASPSTHPIRRWVTLRLTNASLQDILGYVVNQTNLEYRIEPDSVIVEPWSN